MTVLRLLSLQLQVLQLLLPAQLALARRGAPLDGSCDGVRCPGSVEASCTDEQVFNGDIGCCGECVEIEEQDSANWAADHPVYRATTCPGRLWKPSEIPQVDTFSQGT